MKKQKIVHIWETIKALLISVFGSKYVLILFEAISTVVISIHTANVDFESKKWITKLLLYVGVSILLNILCVWADCIKESKNSFLSYFSVVYDIQNKINSNTSTKLYRVNKKVTTSIRNRELIKGEINSIADFQTLSFDVCNELHSFIINFCDCDECEVTIFQRFTDDKNNDFVTMIAYKNSQNRQPATYGKNFNLTKKKNVPLFINLFKDANAEIKILHNKKQLKKDFIIFDSSRTREERICQYIGIPIRTNRNKVEILLQIDVSKAKVFGNRYKTIKKFAENIFLPFATLLYCSYERDLVLNKFYDVLEENIEKRSDME